MKRLGLAVAVFAMLSFFLVPFGWQLLAPVTPEGELFRSGLPSTLTLAHYRGVFETAPFARIVLNSLLVASATTFVSLAIGTPAAFARAPIVYVAMVGDSTPFAAPVRGRA